MKIFLSFLLILLYSEDSFSQGRKMHVKKYGTGSKVLILIHGGPSLFGYMSSLGEKLSSRYKIIDYAQRGTFETPGQISELSIDSHTRDLVSLIKRYRSEGKVILIGHSWGADLALLAVAKNPNIVEKVILLGTAALTEKIGDIFGETLNKRYSEEVKKELEDINKKLSAAETDQEKNKIMQKRLELTSPYYHLNPKTELLVPDSKWNFVTFSYSIDSLWDIIEAGGIPSLLNKVEDPVVAFHGDTDPIPYKETFQFLKRNIKDVKTIKVEKAGHFPWLEETSREKFMKQLLLELE